MNRGLELGPVPVPIRYVSWISLFASLLMIFLGGWRIGVTWDEPLHVQRLNNYLDTGWYLGYGQLHDGQPEVEMMQQFVYAPVTMLFLHGLGVIFGVESWGTALGTPEAYAVRHFGIGMLSLVGVAAVGLTTRLMTRRWDWAVVGSALFISVPLWTGHAMFNLKDVPVATGYALATLGLCIITAARRASLKSAWIAGPASFALGIVLAVGTRPGMWTGLVASTGVLLVCSVLRARGSGNATQVWREARDVCLGVMVAGAALFAIYPAVFKDPISAMWNAAFESANFLGSHSPRTFIPVRVFLQMPLLDLVFIVAGTVVGALLILKTGRKPGTLETRILLVFVQVFTMPLVAMVHGASLYGDLRQVLFVVPGAALLATIGMSKLLSWMRARGDRNGRGLVIILSIGALALPIVGQAVLFPFNYAYYNPLLAVAGIDSEGDYYRASGRELAPAIPDHERIVCSPSPDGRGGVIRKAHLDGWVDCARTLSSPIAAFLDLNQPLKNDPLTEDFLAVTFESSGYVPANCQRVHGGERWGIWRVLHLATLSRCSRDFPVLSTGEVHFAMQNAPSQRFPYLGWFSIGTDGSLSGLKSRGGPSSLVFRMAGLFRGSAVHIRVQTERPVEPIVRLNGQGLDVRGWAGESPGFAFTVPRTAVERAVTRPVVLAFTSDGTKPLELKILNLRAERVTGLIQTQGER